MEKPGLALLAGGGPLVAGCWEVAEATALEPGPRGDVEGAPQEGLLGLSLENTFDDLFGTSEDFRGILAEVLSFLPGHVFPRDMHSQ